MIMISTDTIAAIATARGTGGIAVIRISGERAFDIGRAIFRVQNENYKNFDNIPANLAVFGEILKNGAVIDEGIITKFYAPRSYTGEDTVEISCHGGMYITNLVLSATIECGARLAQAGEFTKRAYLNGKISLTGAEAVGRLICAVNEIGAKIAHAQSKGGLSREIERIGDKLKQLLSEVYVYIDYPGEDLQDTSSEEMLAALVEINTTLENLRDSYHNAGKIIAEGINCAIIGKPNAGKSTLLNLLAREEAAIVHDTPGTTRDIINVRVNLGRFTLNLFDTAGLRDSSDEIESIGIAKARAKIEECDLIIGVFATDDINEDDNVIIEILRKQKDIGKKILTIVNKCDIQITDGANCTDCTECRGRTPARPADCQPNVGDISRDAQGRIPYNITPIVISARENISDKEGVSALQAIEACLEQMYDLDSYNLDSGEILTEERQYFEICAALENIKSAKSALMNGFSADIAGLDIELAVRNLDRCDSSAVSEDIVARIFKNFCVGK